MLIPRHKDECDCIDCFAQNIPFSYLKHDELEVLNQNKYIVNYNPI